MKILIGIILSIFLFSASLGVKAHHTAICRADADFILNVAYARDAGVPLDAFITSISGYKGFTKEEKQIFLTMVRVIYNNPDKTPLWLSTDFFKYCNVHTTNA